MLGGDKFLGEGPPITHVEVTSETLQGRGEDITSSIYVWVHRAMNPILGQYGWAKKWRAKVTLEIDAE